MKLTENFSIEEFACKDGTQVPVEFLNNVQVLSKNLQVLRDEIGEPLHVNSGYRTVSYNKRVGGKPASQHLKAKAADITAKNFTPRKLAAKIESLIKSGKMKQGGIGIYPGFVHYDVRGIKARW